MSIPVSSKQLSYNATCWRKFLFSAICYGIIKTVVYDCPCPVLRCSEQEQHAQRLQGAKFLPYLVFAEGANSKKSTLSITCDVDDPMLCDNSPASDQQGQDTVALSSFFNEHSNSTTRSAAVVHGAGSAGLADIVEYAFAAYANDVDDPPTGFLFQSVDGSAALDTLVREKTTQYMLASTSPDSSYFDGYDIETYPIGAYALVPAVHIPDIDPDDPIVFSRQTVISIHLGEIQFWDDQRIISENPMLIKKLPHRQINVVVRGGAPDFNLLLTSSFVAFNASLATLLPVSRTPEWCGNSSKLSVTGNPKLELNVVCGSGLHVSLAMNPHVHLVRLRSQVYSFSITPLHMVKREDVHLGSMINKAGRTVAPDIASMVYSEMELGTLLDEHRRADLVNPGGPDSWPMSAYLYLVIRRATQITTCSARIRMLRFWIWFISSEAAQSLLPILGLAPLPTFIQSRVVTSLKDTIKCVSRCAGVYNVSSCTCELRPSRCVAPIASDEPISLMLLGSEATSETINNIYYLYTTQAGKENLELTYVVSDSETSYAQFLADNTTVSFMTTMFEGDKITSRFSPILNSSITIPFATFAVVPIYRCPEIDERKFVVDAKALAQIYMGNITKWNDPYLILLNPDLPLPDKNIIVVTRSDGSDSTQLFTRYLSSLSSEFGTRVGVVRSFDPVWLNGRKVVAKSDFEAEQLILDTDYSITHWQYTKAKSNAMAYVVTDDGHTALQPTMDNIALCANDPSIVMHVGEYTWSTDSSIANPALISKCFPIFAEVDFTIRRYAEGDCSNQIEVVQFLDWLYSSGDAMAVAVSMFGAVVASPESQVIAHRALLQARCNGVSILAAVRTCGYIDMTYKMGACRAWSATRYVDFDWTEGNTRLCSGGLQLESPSSVACDHLPYLSGEAMVVYVICFLGNIMGVLAIVQVIRHWHSKLIIYAQRSFCLIFTAAAVALNNVSLVMLGPNTSSVCMARVWLFNLSATLMYAVLFMKIRRVSVLFGKQSQMKKVKVTNAQVTFQITILLTVDIIILSIWSAASPPAATPQALAVVPSIEELGKYDQLLCSSAHHDAFINAMRIWKGGLLVYGAYLSKLTWNIDVTFSEAKQIAVGMYNSALIAIIVLCFEFVPIDPGHHAFFNAMACLVTANGCLILVMAPKLWLLHFDPIAAGVTLSSTASKNGKESIQDETTHKMEQQPSTPVGNHPRSITVNSSRAPSSNAIMGGATAVAKAVVKAGSVRPHEDKKCPPVDDKKAALPTSAQSNPELLAGPADKIV